MKKVAPREYTCEIKLTPQRPPPKTASPQTGPTVSAKQGWTKTVAEIGQAWVTNAAQFRKGAHDVIASAEALVPRERAELAAKFGKGLAGEIAARNQRDLASSARVLGGGVALVADVASLVPAAVGYGLKGIAATAELDKKDVLGLPAKIADSARDLAESLGKQNSESLQAHGQRALKAASEVVSSLVKDAKQDPEHFAVKALASAHLFSKVKAGLQPREFTRVRLTADESMHFDDLVSRAMVQTDRLAKKVPLEFKGVKVVVNPGETAEAISERFRQAALSKRIFFSD